MVSNMGNMESGQSGAILWTQPSNTLTVQQTILPMNISCATNHRFGWEA